MGLRHRQQSYTLRKMIFDVHNKLRVGWPEEVYHQGMIQRLRDEGIPFLSKPRKAIVHRGVDIQVFECDLLVWDTIILELKALPSGSFAPAHYAQLVHYLKCWNKDLGFLVNFGPTRVQIKRFVWDEPDLEVYETYDAIEANVEAEDRLSLERIRESVIAVGQQYGLGYPETLYRKIVAVECRCNNLACVEQVEIPARWHGHVLAHYQSDHLLVEDRYLVHVRSVLERPTEHDFAQIKTFLRGLGLKVGLLVNFGKKQLQIYGVNPG
jgi:GxxExxY protein